MGMDMIKIKMKYSVMVFCFAMIIFSADSCLSQMESSPQPGDKPVKEVVSAMTLTEKAALVVGMGMGMPTNETDTSEEQDKKAATIESVKSVSDIFSKKSKS